METEAFEELMDSAKEALDIARKTEIKKSGCKVCGKQVRQRSRMDREVPRDICKKCIKERRKENKDLIKMSDDHGHWFKTERSECPGCHKKKITICPKHNTCISCCLARKDEQALD